MNREVMENMNKHGKRWITLAALATTTTAIIHVVNKVVAASASLKEMLDTNGKNYYHWRFGDIYYTRKGNGSPVLLIHDMLPGGSGYEWSRIEDDLALEHTVYSIDLPGCGRSEKPGMTYTNFVYVQSICEFIRNVIREKTDVIVSGYSGAFVIMACRNEEKLFDKIMLVNPVNPGVLKQMPGKKDKLLRRCLEISVFGTLLYHITVSRSAVNDEFVENFAFDPFHPLRDFQDAYYEAAHKGGCYAKNVYANKASKYMNIDITRALKEIDNSLYIVEGEAENNGEATVAAYQNINPSVEAVTINETKHFPQIEDPEGFLEQVGIFF